MFPCRDVRAVLHGELIVHFQRFRKLPCDALAVLKYHADLKGCAARTDDKDVFLIVVPIGVLVLPALPDNARALVAADSVDIDLVDGLARLILDVQSEVFVLAGSSVRRNVGRIGFVAFWSGHADLCQLRTRGLYGGCIARRRAVIHGVPLVNNVALCERLRQVLQRIGIAVVILHLDVVLVLGVLQRNLIGQIAIAVRLEPVFERIADVGAVVKLHIQLVVIGMRTDKALVQIHAAVLCFAGHEGRHLLAVLCVEIVDQVVVCVRVAALFKEAAVHDVLAGLILNLNGEQLISGIHIIGSLADGNQCVHCRLILGVVLQLDLPAVRVDAVLHGDFVVHLELAQLLLRLGAVREDDCKLHLRARFTDDIDVFLIIVAVSVLVRPAWRNDAVALFTADGIDVYLVDGHACLVLEIQSESRICGLRFLDCRRFGSRFSHLCLGRSRRLRCDRFCRDRRTCDGAERHQQRESEGN